MSGTFSRIPRTLIALLLGALATFGVVILYFCGTGGQLELNCLDWRFRSKPAGRRADSILCVDIDDGSIAEIGRWTWPRRRIAQVVETLKQCGAGDVVLDIAMLEPQAVRYVAADSNGESPIAPRGILDDSILATAIANAGNVLLAMPIEFSSSDVISPTEASVANELLKSPLMLAQDVATRLKLDVETVRKVIVCSRRRVISQLAGRVMTDPQMSLAEVEAKVLPGLDEHRENLGRDLLTTAYLERRAQMALPGFAVSGKNLASMSITHGTPLPPLVTLARAADGVGFVSYVADEEKTDGVFRRIPLITKGGFQQLALLAARRKLEREHGGSSRLECDGDSLNILLADGAGRRIPLVDGKYMLVNWKARQTSLAEHHIPAAAVIKVADEKLRITKIDDLAHKKRLEVLKCAAAVPGGKVEKLYWKFIKANNVANAAYQAQKAAEKKAYRNSLYTPAIETSSTLAQLRKSEADGDAEAKQLARELIVEIRRPENLDVFLAKPAAPNSAKAPATLKEQWSKYAERSRKVEGLLKSLDSLPQERRRIVTNAARIEAQLRSRVEGKVCFVGATATGTDLVPTPVAAQMPGVMVHVGVFNTIVSGEFIKHAGKAADIATILIAGMIVTLIVALRPIVQAAIISLLVAVGLVFGNVLLVFGLWSTWLVMAYPLVAMVASFVVVTTYRLLTEERAKRRIRDMFSNALSPALVDELLTNPSLAALGGSKADITCLFSDLAGFTPLSGRLGPHETVVLLNRYFDEVTRVVQNEWGGYVNKFLGDGVFAIFGAPVPTEDHPDRTVNAALAYAAAVDKLNISLGETYSADVQLGLRIGTASGEAMVGNCGSTERMDYTAIGNCVNLAARLESASKFFGTRIIIADSTWARSDQVDLLARPLGNVMIKGVVDPVRIWELAGHRQGACEDSIEAYRLYAEAVDMFERQRFADAGDAFEAVGKLLDGDKPAAMMRDICRECAGAEITPDYMPACKTAGDVVTLVMPWGTCAS